MREQLESNAPRINGRGLALVFVLLLLVLISAASGWLFSPAPARTPAPAPRYHNAYFQSGRWLADARTLVVAVQYLLDPEIGSPQTNKVTVQG